MSSSVCARRVQYIRPFVHVHTRAHLGLPSLLPLPWGGVTPELEPISHLMSALHTHARLHSRSSTSSSRPHIVCRAQSALPS
jgi:hypothetical protein